MRSYGQFCGIARALDVVGDRWSLLIVRELLIRPCRFTDLRAGLPGVARNLLSDRLRALQDADVVAHEADRYVLTERGRALEPVLRELMRWSVPLMVTGRGEDAAQGHWVATAAAMLFDGADLRGLNGLQVAVEAEGETLALRVDDEHRLRVDIGPAEQPDVVLRGSMEGVIATLTGLPSEEPVSVDGDPDRLATLRDRFELR